MRTSRKRELSIIAIMNVIAIAQMFFWDANELFVIASIIAVTIFNGLYFIRYARRKNTDFLQAKKQLSYQLDEVGKEVFEKMPLGIILYDEAGRVEWSNPYIHGVFARDIDNHELSTIDAGLFEMLANAKDKFEFSYKESVYAVTHKKAERVLYFDDISDYADLARKYEDSQATLGLIVLDNYDEVVKNLDEQAQNDYKRQITDRLSNWASEHSVMFRTLRDGRFIILMSHKILTTLSDNRFSILDDIRAIGGEDVILTISMGIASGYQSYLTSFNRASSLVDLALSRGGDQVVIKKKGVDDFLFYGGKTNPIASQNRVRARVNAGAYERLILDSDHVVIMGHKFPDADALGASIGLAKIATTLGKNAYIVLNKDELDKANEIFVAEMLADETLASYFITSAKAVDMMTKNSLLVIADTQNKNFVIDQQLLGLTNKIAIFDHHRRGTDYIEATLSYTDPSVSSTAELVVDMLDYFSKRINLSTAEASIMLSGIMLDTRRFMYNTSKKTYDAAAILKQKGADEKYVARLLKAPIEHYYARAHLAERARVFNEIYLIAAASEEYAFDRTEIAATADDLLNIRNIKASFVLGYTAVNEVAISSRSTGDVNVQLVMEALGGGGHLTGAAARFTGSLQEAVKALEVVLLDLNQK